MNTELEQYTDSTRSSHLLLFVASLALVMKSQRSILFHYEKKSLIAQVQKEAHRKLMKTLIGECIYVTRAVHTVMISNFKCIQIGLL